ILQQGPRHRLCDAREHYDFRREWVRRAIFQSGARGRDELALVLLCAAIFQRGRRALGGARGQHHTDLQHRRVSDDDRSVVDLFLAGIDVHLLARARTESAFLVALADNWIADRPWISLQIHERARAYFSCACTRARAAVEAAICPALLILVAWRVRSLHGPADCVERAARLDHADAPAIARQS